MASLLTRPVPANLALAATYVLLGTVTLTLGSLGGVELRGTVWLASGVALRRRCCGRSRCGPASCWAAP